MAGSGSLASRRGLAFGAMLGVVLVMSAPALAQPEPQSETKVVALYPAPEAYRMGGLPPGMIPASFLAATGTLEATALDDRRTRLLFTFEGLIPNGVYTMWNVLEGLPNFRDEPLGPEGFGGHGVIANRFGRAETVVLLDDRPGEIFLLDYHSDGELTGEKGEVVFPGALWGRFPEFE